MKFLLAHSLLALNIVTPRRGVWIEIEESMRVHFYTQVTPRRGVWIEILWNAIGTWGIIGHSPQGSVD